VYILPGGRVDGSGGGEPGVASANTPRGGTPGLLFRLPSRAAGTVL